MKKIVLNNMEFDLDNIIATGNADDFMARGDLDVFFAARPVDTSTIARRFFSDATIDKLQGLGRTFRIDVLLEGKPTNFVLYIGGGEISLDMMIDFDYDPMSVDHIVRDYKLKNVATIKQGNLITLDRFQDFDDLTHQLGQIGTILKCLKNDVLIIKDIDGMWNNFPLTVDLVPQVLKHLVGEKTVLDKLGFYWGLDDDRPNGFPIDPDEAMLHNFDTFMNSTDQVDQFNLTHNLTPNSTWKEVAHAILSEPSVNLKLLLKKLMLYNIKVLRNEQGDNAFTMHLSPWRCSYAISPNLEINKLSINFFGIEKVGGRKISRSLRKSRRPRKRHRKSRARK